jgi:mannose-1-phosphate guanylyltransferase
MRTMLLAAGLGSRLKPITDITPKCLVPIKGKPLLQIWLERLNEIDIGPFLINTHYLAEKVNNFVNSSPFSKQITLTYEANLLGTAGTILSNMDFFSGEDALVIHADNYCSEDLREFINAHANRPSHCLMTMMIFETDTPNNCGIVEIDHQGIVINMHEKVNDPPGNLANGAIYIFSSELLTSLATNCPHISDISNEVIPRYFGKIYTYQTNDVFLDIGTPETYAQVNNLKN